MKSPSKVAVLANPSVHTAVKVALRALTTAADGGSRDPIDMLNDVELVLAVVKAEYARVMGSGV